MTPDSPPHLAFPELLDALDRFSGIIPVDIDLGLNQLLWMDLEAYHFYEGFLHKSIATFKALKEMKGGQTKGFATDIDVLEHASILKDHVYPAGFIFHAGRCGSTALVKALSRAREHLVLSEPEALNKIWSTMSDSQIGEATESDKNKRLYKHLLLAMARQRLATHAALFVKFTSFNILLLDFITSIFPDVPALFLYREPSRILDSFARNAPGWLPQTLPNVTSETRAPSDMSEALGMFFSAALSAGEDGLRYLSYDQLTAGTLPLILTHFNVASTAGQMESMQSQFDYDSKVEYAADRFVGKEPDKSKEKARSEWGNGSPEGLEELYRQIAKSPFNLSR
jgi:hypothetical protein